eukprot:scaffold11390_cov64-Phaeocystis_antarctica.AAC.5
MKLKILRDVKLGRLALSLGESLVAARKLFDGHAPVLRLIVQLPAPALAAVVALDRVGGVGGVLVGIEGDLRHHRRDDLVRVHRVRVGQRRVVARVPVEPELVVPPRAQHDVRERQRLPHRRVEDQVAHRRVLVRPEGRLLLGAVRGAEVARERRAGDGEHQVRRQQLQRAVRKRKRADGRAALAAGAALAHE